MIIKCERCGVQDDTDKSPVALTPFNMWLCEYCEDEAMEDEYSKWREYDATRR